MAYVIIVEFRAKPDRIAFAEPIDRPAHNLRTFEEGCLAFDVCHDPDDPALRVLRGVPDQEAHRQLLEMDSFNWFRATAPKLGSEGVLPTTARC
jgi:quinol monooxygenase YgiN